MVELIWEGKYRDGKRVDPVRTALPLQTVETVDCPPAIGQAVDWHSRLIWGDKKYVLPSLLPEFGRKVNLVYIDPPFDTGLLFSASTGIPQEGAQLFKEPSKIQARAYRDTWLASADERRRGVASIDKYLRWFYETAVLLRDLLADDGSLYVHIDENAGHYAKAILDEVFGQGCFQREIVWRIGWISGYKSKAKNWIRNHDSLLFYVKDKSRFTFNKEYIPYPPGYTRRDGSLPTGEGYPIDDVWNASEIDRMDSIQIMSFSGEKVGYPTQKNENLLSRIVRASSNEGDLVLDCFCGSGTLPVVAEKLRRRWIACDVGGFAIQTTRKRLLATAGSKPFRVQTLGKYERRAWMAEEFESSESSQTEKSSESSQAEKSSESSQAEKSSESSQAEKRRDQVGGLAAYRKLLLDLYGAESLGGEGRLHGRKRERFVYVGDVDALVTRDDIREIAREARQAAARSGVTSAPGLDVLVWETDIEPSELGADEGVDISVKWIPRDVLDRRAVEQRDVRAQDFFPLRTFSTRVSIDKRVATVELVDFTMPAEDVPLAAKRAISHWSQWVDYFAIDWNFQRQTFNNAWRTYRTRAEPRIELAARHEYAEAGAYSVVVKVTDLLGGETQKTLSLEVT